MKQWARHLKPLGLYTHTHTHTSQFLNKGNVMMLSNDVVDLKAFACERTAASCLDFVWSLVDYIEDS